MMGDREKSTVYIKKYSKYSIYKEGHEHTIDVGV